VHLCQKVPFVLPCCQASAAPRPVNSDSDEKDALFGLDTQITILQIDFFTSLVNLSCFSFVSLLLTINRIVVCCSNERGNHKLSGAQGHLLFGDQHEARGEPIAAPPIRP
jgi:hypothetical protein